MIDELPPAPDPATDSPAEFSAKAAASVLAQRALPSQINAALAGISALAAGGAYAFMYAFDSGTADADPGAGRLRLSSATQNAASAMYIDPITPGGVNIDSLFASMGANTSLTKGAIRLVKASDPATWSLYDIVTITAATGYRRLAVTYRAGSSASPFANGDALMVYIDRVGDRAIDQSALVRVGGVVISSAVAAVDYPSVFTDDFDAYEIDLSGISLSVQGILGLQFYAAGVLNTSGIYGGPYRDVTATPPADTTSFTVGQAGAGLSGSCSFAIDVRCARNANSHKGFGVRGFQNVSNQTAITQEGRYRSTAAVSGFRLIAPGANITGGEINIYGKRRSS